MKLSKCALVIGLMTLYPLLPPAEARAASSFSAAATVREEYNDNLYLTNTGRTQDFITTLSPSLTLLVDKSILLVSLNYLANLSIFADNPQNRVKLVQKGQLDSTVTLLDRMLFVKLSDSLERIPIDQRKQVAVGNILVNQTDSNSFKVTPYWDYPISGTVKSRVSYTYHNLWYSQGDSAVNQTASATVSKEFFPEFAVMAVYSYQWHRPTLSPAYDTQNVTAGASWQVTPKINLTGAGGQAFFDFKEQGARKLDATVWHATADYQMSELFALGAAYSVGFSDSVNLGTYKSDSASVMLAHSGKVPVKLTLFRTEDKYTDLDRRDRSYGASLDTSAPVTPLLTARFFGNYRSFQFFPGNEEADRFSARLTLEYQTKITLLSLGYTFNANYSTVSQNSYQNNIAFAEATFTY